MALTKVVFFNGFFSNLNLHPPTSQNYMHAEMIFWRDISSIIIVILTGMNCLINMHYGHVQLVMRYGSLNDIGEHAWKTQI
jgi:hypothetical protein